MCSCWYLQFKFKISEFRCKFLFLVKTFLGHGRCKRARNKLGSVVGPRRQPPGTRAPWGSSRGLRNAPDAQHSWENLGCVRTALLPYELFLTFKRITK